MNLKLTLSTSRELFPSIYAELKHGQKMFRKKLEIRCAREYWDEDLGFIKPDAPSEYDPARSTLKNLLTRFNVELPVKYPGIDFMSAKNLLIRELGMPLSQNPDTLREAVKGYWRRILNMNYSPTYCRRFKLLLDNIDYFEKRSTLFINKESTPMEINSYMDKFISFLIADKKYKNSFINEHLTMINVALQFFEMGTINKKRIFPTKTFSRDSGGSMYFTTEEIMLLYNTNLKIQEKEVIDLLVFSAFTGLRHSELYYVTQERIHERPNGDIVLERYSPKEKNQNIIPLNDVCVEILNKWSVIAHEIKFGKTIKYDCLLPVTSCGRCNQIIRKVMKRIGGPFNEITHRMHNVGADITNISLPRHQALTFHSARHHYSYYLRKLGLGIEDIAVLMNHKSTAMVASIYKHEDKSLIADKAMQLIKNQ